MYSTVTTVNNTVIIYLEAVQTVDIKYSHHIHKNGNYER